MKVRGCLKILEFGAWDGRYNMALDSHLFSLCEEGCADAFLRFYTWEPPALSLGFHESGDVVAADAALAAGLDVVRRPTGGRAVLHGNDLTYCVVLPLGEGVGVTEVYSTVSACIVEGLGSLGGELQIERGKARGAAAGARPCFASTSRYEVTCGGRKVVGSAQRAGRRSVLQHGSIPVGKEYMDIVRYLRVGDGQDLRRRLEEGTTCLEEMAGAAVNIGEIMQHMREAFIRKLGLRPLYVRAEQIVGDLPGLNCDLREGSHPLS